MGVGPGSPQCWRGRSHWRTTVASYRSRRAPYGHRSPEVAGGSPDCQTLRSRAELCYLKAQKHNVSHDNIQRGEGPEEFKRKVTTKSLDYIGLGLKNMPKCFRSPC